MFICEIWLFDWYFPQFRKSDMSKTRSTDISKYYRGSLRLRDNESRLYMKFLPVVHWSPTGGKFSLSVKLGTLVAV